VTKRTGMGFVNEIVRITKEALKSVAAAVAGLWRRNLGEGSSAISPSAVCCRGWWNRRWRWGIATVPMCDPPGIGLWMTTASTSATPIECVIAFGVTMTPPMEMLIAAF